MHHKPASIFELLADILWHITHCNATPVVMYSEEECYFYLSYNFLSVRSGTVAPWQSNYPGMQLSLLQDKIKNKRFIDYLEDYDEVRF